MNGTGTGLLGRWVAVLASTTVAACLGPAQPTFTDEEVGSRGVGSLEVQSVTRGENPDANGYVVFIDEGTSASLEANGSATFTDLRAGEWEVTISDIAPNCTLSGSNPRTATVVANTTSTIAFIIDCV